MSQEGSLGSRKELDPSLEIAKAHVDGKVKSMVPLKIFVENGAHSPGISLHCLTAGAFSPPLLTKKSTNQRSPAPSTSLPADNSSAYDDDDAEEFHDKGFGAANMLNDGGRACDGAAIGREASINLDSSPIGSPASSPEKPPLRTLLKTPRGIRSGSIRDIAKSLAVKTCMAKQGVRFRDEVDTKVISRLRRSAIEDLFYNSTDMADFRQEAFLEECGLDPSEFM